MRIETTRLTIKTFEIGDESQLLTLFKNNREHLKLVLPRWVQEIDNLEKARYYVKKMRMGAILRVMYPLALWLKEENKLIGEISFFNIDWKSNTMEIGGYIDHAYEGRGLVTEAMRESMKYFFEQFKLTKIVSQSHIHNLASQRLNEKCGFLKCTQHSIEDQLDYYITSDMLV